MNSKRNNKNKVQPTLFLDEGTITYQNTMIQCCNISKIGIAQEEKEKFPAWLVISIILSLFLFTFPDLIALAVMGLAISGIYLYSWYFNNSNLKFYLVLSLNSGENVYLSSEEEWFMKVAWETLTLGMKEGGKMIINFNDCKIDNDNSKNSGVIISGKNNTINDIVLDNKQIKVEINNNEWNNLYDLFEKLEKMHENDINISSYCKFAKEFSATKNKNKLTDLINTQKDIFKDIIAGVASAGAIELLRRVTGINF